MGQRMRVQYSPIPPQKSPTPPQKSPVYLQKSATPPHTSPTSPQKSSVCLQKSPVSVSILTLACTQSTTRPLSKKHAHVDGDCEHSDNVCCGQIVINMGHLSVYVRQRVCRVRARIMFLYTWVVSRFTMSHVSIYVVYTWMHVSIYMNHAFNTYNREYTKHKLQPSCSYIHASCLYLQYVVSLYMRTSASSPSASYSLVLMIMGQVGVYLSYVTYTRYIHRVMFLSI